MPPRRKKPAAGEKFGNPFFCAPEAREKFSDPFFIFVRPDFHFGPIPSLKKFGDNVWIVHYLWWITFMPILSKLISCTKVHTRFVVLQILVSLKSRLMNPLRECPQNDAILQTHQKIICLKYEIVDIKRYVHKGGFIILCTF